MGGLCSTREDGGPLGSQGDTMDSHSMPGFLDLRTSSALWALVIVFREGGWQVHEHRCVSGGCLSGTRGGGWLCSFTLPLTFWKALAFPCWNQISRRSDLKPDLCTILLWKVKAALVTNAGIVSDSKDEEPTVMKSWQLARSFHIQFQLSQQPCEVGTEDNTFIFYFTKTDTKGMWFALSHSE